MDFVDRLRFRDALSHVSGDDLDRVTLYEASNLTVELFKPRENAEQHTHPRDELYIVARGGGEFVVEGRRHPCGPDDLLFVPDRAPHRFENFSDDFTLWRIFSGSEKRER